MGCDKNIIIMSVHISVREDNGFHQGIKEALERMLTERLSWWGLIRNLFTEWTYEMHSEILRETEYLFSHVDIPEEELEALERRFPLWTIRKRHQTILQAIFQ